MVRFLKTFLLVLVVVVGGWTLYHRDQIHGVNDFISLARQHLRIDAGPATEADSTGLLANNGNITLPPSLEKTPFQSAGYVRTPAASTTAGSGKLKIASFRLPSGSHHSQVQLERLARVFQWFDVVAVQFDQPSNLVTRIVSQMNQSGGQYRFIDRSDPDVTLAIVFNQASVELDQSHWYTVNDPQKLLRHSPLVAWFRSRHAESDRAFTFSIVNVLLGSESAAQERPYLSQLIRAVRSDGRLEDDILLAGDFRSSNVGLHVLRQQDGYVDVLANVPTSATHQRNTNNVLFHLQSTVEFTGSSGIYDVMKQLNLTSQETSEIVDQSPVWGEFFSVEGQTAGRIAN